MELKEQRKKVQRHLANTRKSPLLFQHHKNMWTMFVREFFIIRYAHLGTLNKRLELGVDCRHATKFLLKKFVNSLTPVHIYNFKTP